MIRRVRFNHWLLSGDCAPPAALPVSARKLWASLRPCDCAAVAYRAGTIVAFFRYSVSELPSGNHLHAAGTWVDAEHRGQGLALALWQFVLQKERVASVYVATVSRAGASLVRSLRAAYDLEWEHVTV